MIRLYGGDSSARFIRSSTHLSIRARLSYTCRGASSNRAPWLPRQQPRLERKPRRIRRQRHDVGVLVNDAPPGRHLLPDDVAEDAALLRLEVPPRALDLLAHEVGHDRQRDQLRVRVLERRARPPRRGS